MPRIEGSLHRISKEELLAKKKQAAEDAMKAKEAAAAAQARAGGTSGSTRAAGTPYAGVAKPAAPARGDTAASNDPARGDSPASNDPAATAAISPEAKELAAQGGESPAKPVISPADDPPGVKMEKARAFLGNPKLPPEQRKVLEEILNKK